MSRDYGTAACIDCGTVGERILHAGFPHICPSCLFPPTDANDPRLSRAANAPLVDVLIVRTKTVRARKLA